VSIFDKRADPAECDPARLVELVKSGDRAALDYITRCYGARLVAVGRSRCRDEQWAQDAVQDALLSAAEHLEDFRGDGSLEGWLMRMVTNACNRMRRGRKNDPALHSELGDEVGGDTSLPSDSAQQSQLAEALSAALETLPPDDRAIVLLSEVNGWRGPEIAEAMGISPAAVRTRLSRSRRRLRDQLAPVWTEWLDAPEKEGES